MQIVPAACPLKLTANPVGDLSKTRATGFSSLPPVWRFRRVTAKSMPLRAAETANSVPFFLSQNLWLNRVLDGSVFIGVNASADGLASCSEGPWAKLYVHTKQAKIARQPFTVTSSYYRNLARAGPNSRSYPRGSR